MKNILRAGPKKKPECRILSFAPTGFNNFAEWLLNNDVKELKRFAENLEFVVGITIPRKQIPKFEYIDLFEFKSILINVEKEIIYAKIEYKTTTSSIITREAALKVSEINDDIYINQNKIKYEEIPDKSNFFDITDRFISLEIKNYYINYWSIA